MGLGLAAAWPPRADPCRDAQRAPRRPAGAFLYAVHDPTGDGAGPATPPLIGAWRIDPDTGSLQPVAADAMPALYEVAQHPSRPTAAAARSAIERIRRHPWRAGVDDCGVV